MLITKDDVLAYGNEIEDDEVATVEMLIRSASSAITDAAQCPIVERTSTVRLLGLDERLLNLPGLPIVEVHKVTVDGELMDPSEYRLASAGLYRPSKWGCGRTLPEVEVTYRHGLPEVPADIAGLAVAMVMAGLHEIRDGGWELNNGKVSSVDIDDFRERFATTGESVEMVTPMALPDRTRKWLAARFGNGAQVVGTL